MRRLVLVLLALCLGPAAAAHAAPAWRVDALSNTTAAPGGTLAYTVQLTNTGDAPLDGATSPIRFSGTLPRGLTLLSGPTSSLSWSWSCPGLVPGVSQSFACESTNALAPLKQTSFAVVATVDPSASGVVTSSFAVAGGAADEPSASTVDPTTISATPPPFGVDAFDGTVTDAAGSPFTQAGGHPYAATVSVDFNTLTNPAPLKGQLWPVEPVRDVLADLPPGFVGDPTGAAQCTAAQLAGGDSVPRSECPPAAQVGTALVRLSGFGVRSVFGPLPVFNMVPPPDVPARFGFNVAGTVVTLDAELRSATDYGLSVRVRNISQGLAVAGTSLTFWGVPADRAHDGERACPGQEAPWAGGPTCPSGASQQWFLRNPTSCTEPGVGLPTTVSIDSWTSPGDMRQATFVSHLPNGYPFAPADWGPPQGPTGCASVPFGPRLAVAPGSGAAGAPSAYAFDVSSPQSEEPLATGEGDVRRAVVRLPLGLRVNPSAADGLAGCARAEIGLDSAAPSTCPDASKVGSLTIDTPLLDRQLQGSIYLATPHANPFGTLLAVYLVARGPGLIVKLAGRVDADPETGQLTATFDDTPQLPFSLLHLAFDGGPRAPLVSPVACGAHAVTAELTSWSGQVVSASAGFSLGGCGAGAGAAGRRFAPGFSAGVENPAAGGSSPFHLRVTRTDEDEELGGLRVDLPPGLVGRLADVTLCAERAAAEGTCPAASRVGSVVAGAGAGPLPLFVGGGRVYVTGPYKGAPFGLSIVVPAVAGPFDLGLVVVRAQVLVDRRTAELSVVSDPLPRILQGIPLQLRDVRVSVDRPGFMVNPTGCGVGQVGGVVSSAGGALASVSERFAAAECRGLPLRPRLRLTVGGRGRVGAGRSTPLTAVLVQGRGQANLAAVGVTLPLVLNARLGVVGDACSSAQFARDGSGGACARARVGTAVAVTPLLRDPLRGDAVLVRDPVRRLPDLVVALRGQVDFDLVGRVAIPGGKALKATFDAVPDVPISRFVLRLVAGRQGVVGVARGLCSVRARGARAVVGLRGQNGVERVVRERLVVRGCG